MNDNKITTVSGTNLTVSESGKLPVAQSTGGGMIRDRMAMTDGAEMSLACAFCNQQVRPDERHDCEGKRAAEAAQENSS